MGTRTVEHPSLGGDQRLVTIEDLRAARDRVAGVIRPTPAEPSEPLSELAGRPIILKPEQRQRTGSFKIRGAYNRISRLPPGTPVVAGSAGNHAQGVALAAKLTGHPATIFMPVNAPLPKVEATRNYGATVRLSGQAVDDCIASLRWLALHAVELGGDPTRIAVGGDSAGANLAAVCAILARNDGYPKLGDQLLIYPCTAPEPETPSHRKFAEGYLLTRNNITWFYKQYLRSQKDVADFRFAPLVAEDLSNLPPALVLVAGYDPLRDEGCDYARQLIEAGNRVTLVNYEGMIHGFLLMGGALDAAKRALQQSAQALKEAFALPG